MSNKNIVSFEKVLREHGFSCSSNNREDRILCLSASHQIPPYRKSRGGIQIEININFDIFWGEYIGEGVNIDKFIADAVEMDIMGAKIKLLPPLKSMVYLILYHYKEMNSINHLSGHNCIYYNMFKDVFYLWRNNTEEISLDKLYKISAEYEIIPFVFYVLYYTNAIFKDAGLLKYVEVFRTEEGVALLDYYELAEKERKPWKVDFKTRLETENLYELIKNDLTDADFEKLERTRRIFG